MESIRITPHEINHEVKESEATFYITLHGSNGQVRATIPKKIVENLHLKPGDYVEMFLKKLGVENVDVTFYIALHGSNDQVRATILKKIADQIDLSPGDYVEIFIKKMEPIAVGQTVTL